MNETRLLRGRLYDVGEDGTFTMIPTGMDEARIKAESEKGLETMNIDGQLYVVHDNGRKLVPATELEKLLAKTMDLYKDVAVSEQEIEQATKNFLEAHPFYANGELSIQQEVILMNGDEPIATLGIDRQFRDMDDLDQQIDDKEQELQDLDEQDREL